MFGCPCLSQTGCHILISLEHLTAVFLIVQNAVQLRAYLLPIGDIVMSRHTITYNVRADIFTSKVLAVENVVSVAGRIDDCDVYRVRLIMCAVKNTGDLYSDIFSDVYYNVITWYCDLPCDRIVTDGETAHIGTAAVASLFETRVVRVHSSAIPAGFSGIGYGSVPIASKVDR